MLTLYAHVKRTEGFLQEKGPIAWLPGTSRPVDNNLAWSRLTNVLWVEYPVGVGFSKGEITAVNEVDIAKDFVGFFKNWEILFGIKDYKIYITVTLSSIDLIRAEC